MSIKFFDKFKDKPLWDIIFLIVFVIMLFIPVLHIDQGSVSPEEKRALAVWKPLLKKHNKINYNFGKDFDNWFNDRFFLRKFLVYGYKNLDYILSFEIVETPEAILNKKTHWIFSKENLDIDKYSKNRNASALAENLSKFGDYWKARGIKFYVLLIPYQEDVYYEEISPYPSNSAYKVHNKAAKTIQKKIRYPFIYPYYELKAATKTEQIYFKPDYHWTDFGASIGGNELLKEIKKDYPGIKFIDLNDYNVTYNNNVMCDFVREDDLGGGESMNVYFPFLNNSKSFLNTEYKYYENKDSGNLKTEFINVPYKKEKIFYYPKGADLRVVLIGNSMNENLLQFLPYAFKNLKYIRTNTVKGIPDADKYKFLKYYKDEILGYKPDIVILSISRSVLVHSEDFLSEE